MCRVYVKTGSIGNVDNTFFFSLIDWNKSWREYARNFFTETHPVAILMDGLFLMLVSIILSLIYEAIPILFAIVVVVIGFVSLLRWLRKRFMLKQEFIERLNGEYDGD